MTREEALQVSAELDEAGFGHALIVNIIDRIAPPKTYRIQVYPRELTSGMLRRLEEIVEPHGLGVHFGIGSRELDLWPLDRLGIR